MQTMDYFQKLADNSEFAEFLTFGVSPQGRELKYLLVTKERNTLRISSRDKNYSNQPF